MAIALHAGFGFRLSGFEFWVSGFGFRMFGMAHILSRPDSVIVDQAKVLETYQFSPSSLGSGAVHGSQLFLCNGFATQPLTSNP